MEQSELYKPHNATGRNRPHPMSYPMLATFLLTGGRMDEVLGLTLRDVSFKRATIRFRWNEWRRQKNAEYAPRSVPMWPQLREILEPWVAQRISAGAQPADLLFPSPRTGGLITDLRKTLDSIAERAGWEAGEIRTKAFRHTYCAARLQSLDGGKPVANRTVADELGHGGEDLVRKVYGHLGTVRHRAEWVEYRIEQQAEHVPAERLARVRRVA